MNNDGYLKFRGKCKEMSEELIAKDPSLTLVRGYYICPMWGEQAHWWCKKADGTIVDPTVEQFPTAGFAAEYVEFDGIVACSECGQTKKEEEMDLEGRYAFCSTRCHLQFVGLGEYI